MSEKIFVYGALKNGFPYHHLMENHNAERLDNFSVMVEGFKMYDNGFYPSIIYTGKQTDIIMGEVYSLDDDSLEDLISLYPTDCSYLREQITIGEFEDVWIYYHPNDYGCHFDKKYEVVSSGIWLKGFVPPN